jgi:hypothetical protein
MRKKALRVEEREIQVINWFVIRIQHDNDDWASMSEIAKGIGLSPSSHLRRILSGMVSNRSLEMSQLERPGRWAGWGYRLARGTFQRPPQQTREIKFTHNGVTQMELFK